MSSALDNAYLARRSSLAIAKEFKGEHAVPRGVVLPSRIANGYPTSERVVLVVDASGSADIVTWNQSPS